MDRILHIDGIDKRTWCGLAYGSLSFPNEGARLDASHQEALERLLAAASGLCQPETEPLCIHGHADVREGDAVALSRARAEAVRAWLVAHEIAPDRIHIAVWGTQRPITLGDRHAPNRRVDIDDDLRDCDTSHGP